MNAKPTLARPRFLPCFIAALLSAVISAGLLGAVSGLFHSDGIPFGKVVAAERPCRDHAFVSERGGVCAQGIGGSDTCNDRLRAVRPPSARMPHTR
jgi:hypothetical protein